VKLRRVVDQLVWLIETERWQATSLQKTPLRCLWIWSSVATKTCQILSSWKRPKCSLCQHRLGDDSAVNVSYYIVNSVFSPWAILSENWW